MKKILFNIGSFLFFNGLGFCIFTIITSFLSYKGYLTDFEKVPISIYMVIFCQTVLFFVGTYLISNNKPD